MPFASQVPQPFTQSGVALAPDAMGVYALRKGETVLTEHWVYVGKGNIKDRLQSHLAGDNACIARERPTTFLYERNSSPDAREKELILELDPICNKRVG